MTAVLFGSQVNLTERNNADWLDSFTVYDTNNSVSPWANIQFWSAGTSYQSYYPADVVQSGTNLYVANPATPQTWTSAADFATDSPNWVLVSQAVSWGATTHDFTGAVLKMRLVKVDGGGSTVLPVQSLIALTSDGSNSAPISITGTSGGVLQFNLKAVLGSSIPPANYNYDILSIVGAGASAVTKTALWGAVSVVQGAT